MAATSSCIESPFLPVGALIPWIHSSCVDLGLTRAVTDPTPSAVLELVWVQVFGPPSDLPMLRPWRSFLGIRVISSCQAILMAEMLGNVLYLFLFSLLDFAVPLKRHFKHRLSWDHLILCSALLEQSIFPSMPLSWHFSCIFNCKHVLTLSGTVLMLKDRACVCSPGLFEVLYQ